MLAVLAEPPLRLGVAASTAAFAASRRRCSRAIMRALSDAYDAPPPSPPSEDAVVVLGARLDEEPLSVEQEILMSLAIIELALGVLVVLGVLATRARTSKSFRKRRLPELAPARLRARVARRALAARPAALARLHVVARRPRDVRAGAEPRRVS